MTYVPGPLTSPPPSSQSLFPGAWLFKKWGCFLNPQGRISGWKWNLSTVSFPAEGASWRVALCGRPVSWLDGEKRVLMRMCAALPCVSSPLPSMPFLSALCVRVCGGFLTAYLQSGRVWTEKLNRFEIESGVFVLRCERQREGERVNEPVWSITRPSKSSTAWNSGWRTGRGPGGGPGW